METIVTDNSHEGLQSNSAVTDLLDENSNDCLKITDYNATYQFKDIYKENKLLGDFIDKCISFDEFGEMVRVMNKIFVPLYKETSDDFKKSHQFNQALTIALRNLEMDPDHKFSHIKVFCKILKLEKLKRRVKPITLSKNVSGMQIPVVHYTMCYSRNPVLDTSCGFLSHLVGGTNRRRRKFMLHNKIKNHRLDNTLIDLDRDCISRLNMSDDTSLINQDDHTVNQKSENTDDTNYDSKCKEEIENVVTNIDVATNDNEKGHATEERCIEADTSEHHIRVDQEAENSVRQHHICKTDRIKEIENTIAKFQDIIEKLEETEVLEDDWNSPYVRCAIYQKKILALYKELCTITGDEPVKRHTVRLKASNTRSNLPIQKLEAMINNSIKSNGMPTFPDFGDVVNCVTEANDEGSLGWNKKRIMQQARVLFTHCGRTLQRKRQKREWRSLLSRVKSGLCDPADYDPELRARLEANHQIARKKEKKIIERTNCNKLLGSHVQKITRIRQAASEIQQTAKRYPSRILINFATEGSTNIKLVATFTTNGQLMIFSALEENIELFGS